MRIPPEGRRDTPSHGGAADLNPAFLLSPGPRLFFLRFIIVSSSVMTGLTIYHVHLYHWYWPCFGKILLGSGIATIIHHLSTAFGPRIPLPIGADFCLTTLETVDHKVNLTAACYATIRGSRREDLSVISWDSKLGLFSLAVVWILGLSLLCLLVLRAIVIFREKGNRFTGTRLDIAHLPLDPWWRYPIYSLFGRSLSYDLWRQIVPATRGESRWLAILRGLLTVVSVCTLIAFGVYYAIVEPLSEMGITRYRSYRTRSPGSSLDRDSRWNLIVQSSIPVLDLSHSPIAATYKLGAPSMGPPLSCLVVPLPLSVEFQGTYGMDSYQVKCPLDAYQMGTRFDLTVDHSKYGRDLNLNIVAVYIGLTRDVDNVVDSIDPVFLFPGAHLLTVVHRGVRQRLKPGGLATMGFETFETFTAPIIKQIIPNSAMDASNNPNISSLQIIPDPFTPDWIVVQEYRNKSVFTGLSFLGGLGSFLSTLLVILLGTSLMQSVIGTKPHSPFGFLHGLRAVQAQMIRGCEKMYPKLREEVEGQKENPGVVAYIMDTLLDMEVLGLELGRTSNGTDPIQGDSASPNAGNHVIENAATIGGERSSTRVEMIGTSEG
ncbi:hypothetical protein NMY22_g16795 [Coprinellus aureogranulatus]|nr:hypothetical protein NMY22_g16795 [Coprinellus aureogranulatus]